MRSIIPGIAIVLLILAIVLFNLKNPRNTDSVRNRMALAVFDLNYLHVKCTGGEHINIKWMYERDSALVYENSKYVGGIKSGKGMHIFTIIIDHKPVFEVAHFNEQNWYSDYYTFVIIKKGSEYYMDVKTDGLSKNMHVKKLNA